MGLDRSRFILHKIGPGKSNSSSLLSQLKQARASFTEGLPDRIFFVPYTGSNPKEILFGLLKLRILGAPVRPEGIYIHAMPGRFWNAQYDAGLVDHQAVTALRAVGQSERKQYLEKVLLSR